MLYTNTLGETFLEFTTRERVSCLSSSPTSPTKINKYIYNMYVGGNQDVIIQLIRNLSLEK